MTDINLRSKEAVLPLVCSSLSKINMKILSLGLFILKHIAPPSIIHLFWDIKIAFMLLTFSENEPKESQFCPPYSQDSKLMKNIFMSITSC